MKKILVLTDSVANSGNYLIYSISQRWKQVGHKVILHQGTKNIPDADIVILHVDRTKVHDDYIQCLSRFPIVLNRKVTDISKKIISKNIIEKNDNYCGPVIVKTNANYGGLPEASNIKRLYLKLASRLTWGQILMHNPENYPVFENTDEVPNVVWQNKDLIVEKFLPEIKEGLYYLRYWIFLGARGWTGRFGARDPIVKFSKMVTKDEEVPVPEELKIIRKGLGFDYGRFDYVEQDGKPVLFDVNKTMSGTYHLDAYSAQLDMMAEGINDF